MKLTNAAVETRVESPLAIFCEARPEIKSLLLATLFGALTALSAQVSIRLPFTPVPITGQVFMALLAGALLGPKLGALSQFEYLLLGAAGLPVFTSGGGLLALVGPTGGYLFGFVGAAWIVGTIIRAHRGWLRTALAHLAGIGVIYLCGWLWLACWLGWHNPAGDALLKALAFGVVPFIGIDLAKAFLASQVISSINLGSARLNRKN